MNRPATPPTPSPGEVAAQLATAMAAIADGLAPLLEAVEGYRARLEAAGWGEGLARRMAADYHAALLRMVLK